MACMDVLVVGSGGREHALVKACLKSSLVNRVLAAPGNGGMAAEVTCLPLKVDQVGDIVELAKAQEVDFVIIGPEVPLALGAADALQQAGILVYGPGKDGARLEASKVFTKAFLQRHKIPTAAGQSFTDAVEAVAYLKTQPMPIVIKASGLAAGKGVIIAPTLDSATEAVTDMLEGGKFGDSGREVLIEAFMDGEEASIMLMVSGTDYVMLPASQDHKRAFDGDQGPNTGGMGAYAPAPVVTESVRKQLIQTIIEPTLHGLKAEGIDYRGTLYIGIMVVEGVPKVVEFNVRFGDPECQILLPLLAEDSVQLMLDCARGQLRPAAVRLKGQSAMVVVMAAGGYPGPYEKGAPIQLPANLPGTEVLHAGTRQLEDGTIVTDGGRVLGVVAVGETLEQASKQAYAACAAIHCKGSFYRKDIGARALSAKA